MKESLIALIFLFGCNYAIAQGGVVSAPVLELQVGTLNANQAQQTSIQSTMSGVIAAIESAEKEYKEAMTKSTWMRNMQSAKRFLSLIENLVCTSKDLNIKIAGSRNGCLVSYRYEMLLIKIQMAADYLGIVLSGVSMTVSERASTMSEATKSFHESQEMMVSLNKELDDQAAHDALVAQVENEVSTYMGFDRSKKF